MARRNSYIPFNSMIKNDPDYDWNNEQVFDGNEALKLGLERYMRDFMLADSNDTYVYTHDNRVINPSRSVDFHVPLKLRIFPE